MGLLYHVDMWLRPTGGSGSLGDDVAGVSPLLRARPRLWERAELTRAGVYGDAGFGEEVMAAVRQAAFGLSWKPNSRRRFRAMRGRLSRRARAT